MKQILIYKENLQKAVDFAVETLKNELNFDVENDVLTDKQLIDVNTNIVETLCEFAIYNDEIFDFAKELFFFGYNILKHAVENKEVDIMIVNDLITDFVIAEISSHQKKLRKE